MLRVQKALTQYITTCQMNYELKQALPGLKEARKHVTSIIEDELNADIVGGGSYRL